MPKPRIATAAGRASVPVAREPGSDRATTALAVRYLLQVLADSAPGTSVEVRVPPFGAVQCVPGPTHTRGTPPNVVETDSATFIGLATGTIEWADATSRGLLSASGARADLSAQFPLAWSGDPT